MIEAPWLPMDRKVARQVLVISVGFIVGTIVLCGTVLWKVVLE